jgi:SAM-dependent methyltransferase
MTVASRSRYYLMPPKLKALRSRFRGRAFRVLDVGAGNHSASITKSFYPRCSYEALDRVRDYNNDAGDWARTDAFHEIDLERVELGSLPDGGYDAILMAHVLEHLQNGEAVLRALTPKLAPGGIFYVEFPSPRSTRLPSMRGTLNFWDDPTHVRPWTAGEVAKILDDCGLTIRLAGRRRDLQLLLLTPLVAIRAKTTLGYVPGGVFWDLMGFADRVVAERPGGAMRP